MRVQIVSPGAEHRATLPEAARAGLAPGAVPDTYGPWRPGTTIGAQSAGGLMLPDAHPTASTVYAPRGVHLDDRCLVVADTGNHRVLVLDPRGGPARVVLGQPDEVTEGPQAGGRGPELGMHLPTGVLVTDDGRLVVADAWNHRILVWDQVPDAPCAPDVVLGQPDAVSIEPNGGGEVSGSVFYQPFGIALIDGRFHVADTYNRRVLVWADGIPDPGRPADVVLGQPDASSRDENRGVGVGPDTFRWPHAICSNGAGLHSSEGSGLYSSEGSGLLIADAGNHRVLGWHAHPDGDRPADYALGQPDLETGVEFPYQPQTGTGFRFPYAVARIDGLFAVADTANNRVLLWDDDPRDATAEPSHVLGQPTFAANGENRWEAVADDTLCWPYGLSAHGDRLAIADSGNNRVVVWERG